MKQHHLDSTLFAWNPFTLPAACNELWVQPAIFRTPSVSLTSIAVTMLSRDLCRKLIARFKSQKCRIYCNCCGLASSRNSSKILIALKLSMEKLKNEIPLPPGVYDILAPPRMQAMTMTWQDHLYSHSGSPQWSLMQPKIPPIGGVVDSIPSATLDT